MNKHTQNKKIYTLSPSTDWASRGYSEIVRFSCVHHGQILNPTKSSEWTHRAHSEVVRLACVHNGLIHTPTSSSEWALNT